MPFTTAYPGYLRPPPDPIKGCPHSGGAPHTFNSPPPFLSHAHTIIAWSQTSTTGAPPPRHHTSSGERSPGRTASPSSRCHPHSKPSWPGAASRPSSSEPPPRPCPWSTVSQCRPWSMNCGPSPHLFQLENNLKPIIPRHIAKRPVFLCL
jgi:hypothetical protein